MAQKAVITDYAFENIDTEKHILEPLGLEVVGQRCKTADELIALTKDADYVITQFAKLDAAVIGAMQKAKVIVRYGIGVDNVDLQAAAAKKIPVCNVPDYCIDEVADHALSLILDLTRRITQGSNVVHSGQWKLAVPLSEMRVLRETTVGLVAFGRIAREVAARLKAFKATVLVFDPMVDGEVVRQAGCIPATLDELLAKSDIVSLHCPSTPKTKFMINNESIAKMKNASILINTSRGDLVQTDDLIAALKSGKISAAGLDVTYPEPINADNALLTMDNVLITSHIASCSPTAVAALRASVAHTVVRAFRGEKFINVVNGVTV
jgi:D-3-phosphoglycerate dehydrogenase